MMYKMTRSPVSQRLTGLLYAETGESECRYDSAFVLVGDEILDFLAVQDFHESLDLGAVLIALAYGAAVFWVTRSLNVPINEALATWSPTAPPPQWLAARTDWNAANAVRAGASALCFAAAVAVLAWPRRAVA